MDIQSTNSTSLFAAFSLGEIQLQYITIFCLKMMTVIILCSVTLIEVALE